MTIKGLLFDKDGTLFHYTATWGLWCRRVLLDLTDGDENRAKAVGFGVGYMWESDSFVPGSQIVNGAADEITGLWHAELPHLSVEHIDAVCLKHLSEASAAPVCDFHDYLPKLKAAGFKLGVATNDFEIGATSQLGDYDAVRYFDFICGFDSGFGSKPGPGMIYGFCEATGLKPHEVAMVGDSTHDLFAGEAAGVGLKIGVLTGPATAKDIEGTSDVILPDITSILDHLR